MIRSDLLRIGAVAALVAGIAGCDNDPAASGAARVSVQLTDAPGDFVSAEVEILEIYLQGADGVELDDQENDDEAGRVTLYTGSQFFDLLELRNGVTAELADVTVPPGSYSELRLIVGDARIETEDGSVYSTAENTLHCPSCAQSGLKVKLPGGAVQLETGDQSLIIDFDVAQSFGHAAGNSGRWIMHPVIRATRAEVSASIAGTVALDTDLELPACGGADVTVEDFLPTFTDGDVTLSDFPDAEGDFRVTYVAPGTYTAGYDSDVEFDNGDVLTFTATSSVDEVTLGSGEVETVDYTILTATCTAGS